MTGSLVVPPPGREGRRSKKEPFTFVKRTVSYLSRVVTEKVYRTGRGVGMTLLRDHRRGLGVRTESQTRGERTRVPVDSSRRTLV